MAVLDTGVAEAERAWFAGRVTGDAEVPDEDRDGGLDRFAGHGTFIAGVVLQHAPAADVVVKRNLHAAGYVSDAALAMALLASAGAHVINLSLGGYTHDNLGLAATARALQLLLQGNPQLSVVAAAGNDGTDRQFYPAAFNSVIAVGALGADGRRAWFSNWGWWVDASVPGVGVGSTYLHLDGGLRSTYVNMDGTLRTGTTPALYEGWAEWDGTSFASARMAGAIAVLAGSGLPPREAASRLVYGPGVARVPGLGALPRLTSFV